jgi:uncharacterized protein YoxC
MSGVWLVIAPIAIIALLFVLKAVRDVGRNIRKLSESMQELSEAGVGLTKIRDDLAALRATIDEQPPQ